MSTYPRAAAQLAFFRDDVVLVTTDDHTSLGADFVRDGSWQARDIDAH
jgi:hypothetical protein